MRHRDHLTDEQYGTYRQLAEKYDRRAREDSFINLRISSSLLAKIQKAAKDSGYKLYQTWICETLKKTI